MADGAVDSILITRSHSPATLVSNESLPSTPAGINTTVHGSCSRCHHLHINVPVIIPDHGAYIDVRCAHCEHGWLGLGQSSARISLASLETIPTARFQEGSRQSAACVSDSQLVTTSGYDNLPLIQPPCSSPAMAPSGNVGAALVELPSFEGHTVNGSVPQTIPPDDTERPGAEEAQSQPSTRLQSRVLKDRASHRERALNLLSLKGRPRRFVRRIIQSLPQGFFDRLKRPKRKGYNAETEATPSTGSIYAQVQSSLESVRASRITQSATAFLPSDKHVVRGAAPPAMDTGVAVGDAHTPSAIHHAIEETQQDETANSTIIGQRGSHDIAGGHMSKEQRLRDKRRLLTQQGTRCTCDCVPHCPCWRSSSTGAARYSSACHTPLLGIPDNPLADGASIQSDTSEPPHSSYRQSSPSLAGFGAGVLGHDVAYQRFGPLVDRNSSGSSVGVGACIRDLNRGSVGAWSTASTTVEQNPNMTDDQLDDWQSRLSAAAPRSSSLSFSLVPSAPRSQLPTSHLLPLLDTSVSNGTRTGNDIDEERTPTQEDQ